jgi:hypothetical protein
MSKHEINETIKRIENASNQLRKKDSSSPAESTVYDLIVPSDFASFVVPC